MFFVQGCKNWHKIFKDNCLIRRRYILIKKKLTIELNIMFKITLHMLFI